MKEQTYKGKTFLEYANEAAGKIREAHQVMSGGEPIPEWGSLLGDAYYGIADMIQEYLTTIGIKISNDDKFNNMITEIMFAEKNEISSVIEKYCKTFT